jgi:hypothetical protein
MNSTPVQNASGYPVGYPLFVALEALTFFKDHIVFTNIFLGT